MNRFRGQVAQIKLMDGAKTILLKRRKQYSAVCLYPQGGNAHQVLADLDILDLLHRNCDRRLMDFVRKPFDPEGVDYLVENIS